MGGKLPNILLKKKLVISLRKQAAKQPVLVPDAWISSSLTLVVEFNHHTEWEGIVHIKNETTRVDEEARMVIS